MTPDQALRLENFLLGDVLRRHQGAVEALRREIEPQDDVLDLDQGRAAGDCTDCAGLRHGLEVDVWEKRVAQEGLVCFSQGTDRAGRVYMTWLKCLGDGIPSYTIPFYVTVHTLGDPLGEGEGVPPGVLVYRLEGADHG